MPDWSAALDLQERLHRDWITLPPAWSPLLVGLAENRGVAARVAQIDVLATAEPIWIGADVPGLLSAALATWEPEPLREPDVPFPIGFAHFSEPLAVGEYPTVALSWRRGSDGVELAAYSIPHPGAIAPRFVCGWRWGERRPIAAATNPNDPESPTDRVNLLAPVLWRLMGQRIAVASREPADRAARRRRARSELDGDGSVTVIRLRRPKQSREPDESGQTPDWRSRWIVRGHWRNQWYGSIEDHRQIWIAPYVKGPEGKPLRATERVFNFTR